MNEPELLIGEFGWGTFEFSAVVNPATQRKEVRIRQLSGPPFTDEEWERLRVQVVEMYVKSGSTVYGTKLGTD